MQRTKQLQLAVVGAAVLIGVLIFFAPRQTTEGNVEKEPLSDLDLKVDSAVSLVSGSNPMAGIMLLREVLNEDPKHVPALYQLGVFSMQSRQFDKAVERFLQVLSIDPEKHEAHFFLGQAYAALGNKEEAVKRFEKYKTFLTLKSDIEEVEGYIKELKQN